MKSVLTVSSIAAACCLGAAAATQPDALDGLAFWVRADTGVTTNASGNVTEWADQSGRANHAVAADAAAPQFVAVEAELNSHPTLRFNGTSQRMTVATRILTNGITGCTVIAMAKATKNEDSTIVGIRTGMGAPFLQLDTDNTGKPRFIFRNSADTTANAVGPQARTNIWGMYAGRLHKGSGTVWTNRLYFSSSVAEAVATADFGANTDLTSGDQYIGGLSFAFWQGDIAEVMVYERVLSEAELAGVLEYLTARYTLNRSAPPVIALADIPGLKLWLRSDACVYNDRFANDAAGHNEVARLWSDATTNDHDAVAVDTPTLVTNVVNGLPAMGFTMGGADRFYLENPITTDPRQLTVFAVFRQWTNDTVMNMIFTHRSTYTPLVQASFENATNAVLQIRGGSGIGGVQKIAVPGLLTNGAFNVAMYQFDAVNDRHAVAVNGGAEAVNTYDFGSQTFIADTQRVGYYSLDGSGGLFLHGHLAELLVYEGVSLTRKQKNAIGYYLETKYALDTGYAPGGTLIRVQ